MARGKKYKAAAEKIDKEKTYPLDEAVSLLKEASYTKFDGTVDLAINLGVDPRQADQNVRGATPLPHGLGKSVRIIVFAKGDKAVAAQAAGVEFVGAEDLTKKIQEGWLDFDQVIATPDMMGQVGRLGKVLGPRGLMPNPKLGTVTFEIEKVINELKAGRAEYKVDKAGIVHTSFGKVSMEASALAGNARAIIENLVRTKPLSSKGTFLKKVCVSSTMGPSIRIDTSEFKV